MVFNCKGFYFDEEDEAFRKNSSEKRAEELPADEKSKKPRGSKAKRVVPVANANTEPRHQMGYDGTDDQSKKTSKAIDDIVGANSKNSSRRSRVASKESFEEQKPQNFELIHPQLPKGRYGSDDKKSKKKPENPSAEKVLDESILLRIKLECYCGSCRWKIHEAARKFTGVSAVSGDTSADLVRVTGKMNVKELLIYLKKKLKKNVEVVPAEKDDYPEKDRECNFGNDFMEPHQKMENSGNQKTQKECLSPLLLRIRMHCKCDGCVKKMKDIFKGSKGVGSVNIHRDKDLVEVTGTMDTNKFVLYLEEKLRRNVEVMPIQNNENGASSTQKQGAGVRHVANITDNASRKNEVHPDMRKLEKQNLEKTELTFPQPRRSDRNYNEVTGMVHLKIGMHCLEGCIPQTRKTLMNFTGVESVEVDESKDLVIVVGAINVKELVAYLKKKLKRSVEVVLAPKDNVTGENREEEVTKTETLKELAASEDGRSKDVEIKKEAKKEANKKKIEEIGKDAKVEDKKYSLHGGAYDGTKEDKEDKNGNEGVEDKVKNAKGHGYISRVGEKNKELEREGENYYENYGKQDFPRHGLYNYDNVFVYRDDGIQTFSDENPNSCAIL